MNMAIGMTKVNWRHSKTAYLIAGITFLVGLSNYIVWPELYVNGVNSGSYLTAMGDYLYLLPVCLGIFVPTQNFRRLMNLGGNRMDFFKSGALTYVPVAATVSLLSVIAYLTIDAWMIASFGGGLRGVLDLLDAFGFMARGPVVAFFQMSAFLIFAACVAHTLTLIQGHWYGWVTDGLLIAVLCVFTPVEPIRDALVWFWNMAIFHSHAIAQIAFCLALGAAVYCASLIPIKSKII
jgi:hypothetical protein